MVSLHLLNGVSMPHVAQPFILKSLRRHLPSHHALAHALGDGRQSANNGYHMGHLAVIRIGINVGQLFKLAIILYIENAHVSIPQRLERQTTKLPQRAAAKSIAPIVAVPIGGGAMIVAWPSEGLIRSQ
jgi:hypothetical protein